jgi:triacylglycerol lipase
VKVFLIHGMGRTSASMILLARRLRQAGHETSSFGYFVTRDTLEGIAGRFTDHVEKHAAGEEYGVMGHSLGNVLTRLASPRLPRMRRFIMLAPPNQPPVMARALQNSPVFRALTRDAGEKLRDPQFFERLPVPSCPSLIIAGTRGPSARFLPFRGARSDGVVAVEETRLHGVPHIEVESVHTFIMNSAEVARLALQFLKAGTLVPPGGHP